MSRDAAPVAPGAVGHDSELDQLISNLPEVWANVPADRSGEDIAFAYIRAAYGRGYVRALEAVA